ncbi:biotin synthase [Parelusimicrobium proximum]|uniref:[FeFe] hydrogenase H-cluster radical SAM maturase HydE n=1 Tax=Parelusimicrobium proximum TaxID=3228953 RepID=UPI003D1668EB
MTDESNINTILSKAESSHSLTKEEIITLLESDGGLLFKSADRVRAKYVGDEVHLRGLLEISNICSRSCLYCGIRKENEQINRYCMSADEIISLAQKGKDYGFKTIVMQSGESAALPKEDIIKVIRAVKDMGLALTLSLGEKSSSEYAAYKEAGADRYLLRIETTDEKIFDQMHPGQSFSRRVKCLVFLKELGFELGTGILVGLPGQSAESVAGDILFFKSMHSDMIGLGPFIPSPGTPLAGLPAGSLDMSIKALAITRLLLPRSNIPATTSMETLSKGARIKALQSGANVIMPNITDNDLKKDYALYPGKASVSISADNAYQAAEKEVKSIGRTISTSFGSSPK